MSVKVEIAYKLTVDMETRNNCQEESCLYAFSRGFTLSNEVIDGNRRQKFSKQDLYTYYINGYWKIVGSYGEIEFVIEEADKLIQALNDIDSILNYSINEYV